LKQNSKTVSTLKRLLSTNIKGVISLSKATKKKLSGIFAERTGACSATSQAALINKLVHVLGIGHRQLPGALREANLKIVEDPTTKTARLAQAS
jgi:hypothetical protein